VAYNIDVQSGRWLRWARLRAGKSQQQLSVETGIGQAAISDIERGLVDPHVRTLRLLLRACGQDVELAPARGYGVDRSMLRGQLALTPAERLRRSAAAANSARRWHGAARAGGGRPVAPSTG
jgi:transcriptional regulator with XRE-family HTH domain